MGNSSSQSKQPVQSAAVPETQVPLELRGTKLLDVGGASLRLQHEDKVGSVIHSSRKQNRIDRVTGSAPAD